MAAHLLTLVRENRFDIAERQLQDAIETGTLAAILIDWLHHPELPAALQSLGSPESADGKQSPPQTAFRETTQSPSPSVASENAELKVALDREREKADSAARDLATAASQLNALENVREREVVAAANDVAALQGALAEQRARANAALEELARVTGDLHALQEERNQDPPLMASTASQDAAGQERERADVATRQLSAALDELRTFKGLEGAGPTPVIYRLDVIGIRPANPEIADSLAMAQPAAAIENPAEPRVITGTIPASPPQSEMDGPPRVPASVKTGPTIPPSNMEANSLTSSVEERLVMRGDALFRQGDVSGARLLLERAREAGSARAIFVLAETYDPRVLSERGVIGIRSDSARARDLYADALARGVGQASARLEALK